MKCAVKDIKSNVYHQQHQYWETAKEKQQMNAANEAIILHRAADSDYFHFQINLRVGLIIQCKNGDEW